MFKSICSFTLYVFTAFMWLLCFSMGMASLFIAMNAPLN